jgi:adenylate cyclase
MTQTNLPEGITRQDVGDALARVTSHKSFSGAARLRQLLEYVVSQTLAGKGDELKEYAIAVDVLDKPDDFDPQTDSVVRVMLGRVRNALELYYATDGAQDRVQISIPRGQYQPVFKSMGTDDQPTRKEPLKRRSVLAVLSIAALGLLASWQWLAQPSTPVQQASVAQPETRIGLLVQHFKPVPDSVPASPLAARLASGLSGEMLSDLLVYPWINAIQMPNEGRELDGILSGYTGTASLDYILTGTVSVDETAVTVTARLVDASTLKAKWSRSWNQQIAGSNIEEFQRRMVQEIAGQLASEKGLLPQLAIARKGPERQVDFSGFKCFLGIYQYWDVPSPAAHASLRDCLQAAVAQNPSYADAWAALAYIYIDEERYARNPRDSANAFADARAAVDKAQALDPANPVVLGAAMTLAIEQPGRDVEAFHRYAGQALGLRTNDSFAMANYGMKRAIYLGEWSEGLALNARAQKLVLSPPGWYYLLPAFDALRRPDDSGLLELVSKVPPSHSVAVNMLRAIAAHRAGRKDLLAGFIAQLAADGITDLESARRHIRNRRFEPALQQAFEEQFAAAWTAARTS